MKDKEKDCPVCKGTEVCTEDDLYDVGMVMITPLPAVNLTTGEKEGTVKPPYYALSIGCDDQSKDYFPIEYCPWCGRKLQEET